MVFLGEDEKWYFVDMRNLKRGPYKSRDAAEEAADEHWGQELDDIVLDDSEEDLG